MWEFISKIDQTWRGYRRKKKWCNLLLVFSVWQTPTIFAALFFFFFSFERQWAAGMLQHQRQQPHYNSKHYHHKHQQYSKEKEYHHHLISSLSPSLPLFLYLNGGGKKKRKGGKYLMQFDSKGVDSTAAVRLYVDVESVSLLTHLFLESLRVCAR